MAMVNLVRMVQTDPMPSSELVATTSELVVTASLDLVVASCELVVTASSELVATCELLAIVEQLLRHPTVSSGLLVLIEEL